MACGKVGRGHGSELTEPSEAGQSATSQSGAAGSRVNTGGRGQGGGASNAGGKSPIIVRGGAATSEGGEESAAGGAFVTPGDCTYYDDKGECATPPQVLATIANCGKLQLRREGGVLFALSLASAQLWRIGLNPPTAPTVLAGDLFDVASKAAPSAFTTDSKSAYVAAGMTITRIDLSTGARATVTTVGHTIVDVAVAGDALYYIRGNELVTVSAVGSNNVGQIHAIADGAPLAIAFTANHMIWGDEGTAQVEALQMPLPNGNQFTLAPSQGALLTGPGSLQVDLLYVYWSNFQIHRAAPDRPAEVPQQFGSASDDVVAFTLNATPNQLASTAYFATSTGELRKAQVGADSEWLASDVGTVTSVAADIARVYAANTDCKVLAVPN